MHIIFSKLKFAFLLTLFTVLSACEATITTHGRFIEAVELERLELGVTTQAETIAILGRPSFEGAFNSGRLYYNNQKMEEKVAGTTSTIERELIILIFDENKILQRLELRDKNSDEEIVKLEAKTPTPGDTLTIVDQIFSNLRRGNVGE
jgi:outer membrane protein assembly factor BamE (lipoprotein component of BamABCDE complex)